MDVRIKEEPADEDDFEPQQDPLGEQLVKDFPIVSMTHCSKHGWIKENGMLWDSEKAVNIIKKQGSDVLNAAWNDPFKDLEIICKDDFSIRCHRVVLSNVSSMLMSLMQGTMDQDKSTIFMPDFSVRAVKCFLKLCYCVEVEENEETQYSDELDELLNSLDIDLARKPEKFEAFKGNKSTVKLLRHSCAECKKGRKRKSDSSSFNLPSKMAKIAIPTPSNALVLFKCISCNSNIATTIVKHNTIQLHVAKMNPGKSMRYQCPTCVELKRIPFGPHRPRPKTKSESNQKIICWECGVTCKSQETIKRHIPIHFQIHKCSSCGTSFQTKSELEKHEETHSHKFTCVDCDKTFRTKQEIVRHTSTFHMTGIPRCQLCPEKVSGSMAMHIKNHHSGNESHVKCDDCSFEAFNNISLRSHKQRCHNLNIVVNTENTCKNCGAIFRTRYALRKHISKRCKTSQCADCGMVFEDTEDLAKHTARNHLAGVPKCDLCPERVTVNMQTHMKYHHSGREGHIKCELCKFEAFNSKSLTAHMRRCHSQ